MHSQLSNKAGWTAVLNRILSLRLLAAQLLLLLLLAVPQAFATRADCEKALLTIQALLGDGPKTEVYNDEARRQSSPTVVFESYEQGEHGGQRMVLRRTGARWLSDYRSVRFDPQGDPRWFIETMGIEAAGFFGFKVLGNDRVLVPDGNEFNGAIKKINAQLIKMGKEPIEISFYVTSGNENTKVADYIRAYGNGHGLPLAAGGNHLLHDLSFHTGAIFFPGHLVRLSGYFSRFLDGFLEHIANKYSGDPARAAAVKHIAFLMRMNHTITIDTSTGTVNAGIVASLRRPGIMESLEMLFSPTVLISGEGNTARLYFAKKIDALSPTDMRYVHEYAGLSQSGKTIDALKNLSIAELLDDLAEFANLQKVSGHDKFDKVYVPQTQEVLESFCKGIGLRRLVIRQAALALMKAK